MALNSYKDLRVWQRGIELVKEIYRISSQFPKNETYGLASQIRRAAISIPSNIAEGYTRKSLKEYLQFLRVAYSSAAEIETQLTIAQDLYRNINYSKAKSFLEEIQKMLNVLIRKLEKRLIA